MHRRGAHLYWLQQSEPSARASSTAKKAKTHHKPETPIDFFCEGFARAVAEGVPRNSLLASTAYCDEDGWGCPTENVAKWTKATETMLLQEISSNGNPLICRRFKAFLMQSSALTHQAAKREFSVERAKLPQQVKNACSVLEICCKALRDTPESGRDECFKHLQAAKDVGQPAWCEESLKNIDPNVLSASPNPRLNMRTLDDR